jgi:hypothetical protein
MGMVVPAPLWRWWRRGSARGEPRGEGEEAGRTGWVWKGLARAGLRKGGESAQRGSRELLLAAGSGQQAQLYMSIRGGICITMTRMGPRFLGATVGLDAADDRSQPQTLGSTSPPESSPLSPLTSRQRYGLCPLPISTDLLSHLHLHRRN